MNRRIGYLWALIIGLFVLSSYSIGCLNNGSNNNAADDDINLDDDADDDSDDDASRQSCEPKNYAIQVIKYHHAPNGGFGEEFLPDNVIGPPAGNGEIAPQISPAELFSLGDGGYIILKLGRKVVDGDGPDFIVFENPFFKGGNPDNVFIEAAVVDVSQDGTDWHRFPFDYEPNGENPWSNPDNFSGFAGINPVYANCDPKKFTDPLDTSKSGGDLFDLADVGLDWIAYVKIIDTGNAATYPDSQIYDSDGDPVDDTGNHGFTSPPTAGFDLDAVGVINGGDELEPD